VAVCRPGWGAVNQLDFAMAQLARDLDRLGLPIESVYAAPLVLFVLMLVFEKWRHRAPVDVMAKIQRERYALANRGSSGHGVTVLAGCAAGLAGVFALDWLGVGLGW